VKISKVKRKKGEPDSFLGSGEVGAPSTGKRLCSRMKTTSSAETESTNLFRHGEEKAKKAGKDEPIDNAPSLPESLLDQEGSKEVLGQEGSKEVLDQDGSKEVLDQDDSKEVLDQDGSKDFLGQDGSKEVLGQEGSKEVPLIIRKAVSRKALRRS
jgi:hypothetical protein